MLQVTADAASENSKAIEREHDEGDHCPNENRWEGTEHERKEELYRQSSGSGFGLTSPTGSSLVTQSDEQNRERRAIPFRRQKSRDGGSIARPKLVGAADEGERERNPDGHLLL